MWLLGLSYGPELLAQVRALKLKLIYRTSQRGPQTPQLLVVLINKSWFDMFETLFWLIFFVTSSPNQSYPKILLESIWES